MCIYCYYDFDKCYKCGKIACCKCGYICGSQEDDKIMDYEFVDDIGRDVTDKVIDIFEKHDCKAIDNYDVKCQINRNLDEYTDLIILCVDCFSKMEE